MAVNWNLAAPRYNALETLQAFGAAQQQRMQSETLQRKQMLESQQLQARQNAAGLAAGGDYSGAQQAAVASGDFDLAGEIGKLSEAQRKQLSSEGEAIGRLAYSLRQMPMEQRATAFQASIPALRQQGFTDAEIQAASGDLSDGVLDGYVNLASDIQQQFTRAQPRWITPGEGGAFNANDPQSVQNWVAAVAVRTLEGRM